MNFKWLSISLFINVIFIFWNVCSLVTCGSRGQFHSLLLTTCNFNSLEHLVWCLIFRLGNGIIRSPIFNHWWAVDTFIRWRCNSSAWKSGSTWFPNNSCSTIGIVLWRLFSGKVNQKWISIVLELFHCNSPLHIARTRFMFGVSKVLSSHLNHIILLNICILKWVLGVLNQWIAHFILDNPFLKHHIRLFRIDLAIILLALVHIGLRIRFSNFSKASPISGPVYVYLLFILFPGLRLIGRNISWFFFNE